MFEQLVNNSQIFLIIFARVFAFLAAAPLFSSTGFPGVARVGLGFFSAMVVFPWVSSSYAIPDTGLAYIFILLGESLIGLIIAFIVLAFFSVFQIAGELFGFQMGFNAASVYDPLAQQELPLMGQFVNNIAILIFLVSSGMVKIFYVGIYYSFKYLKAIDIATTRDSFLALFMRLLGSLFSSGFVLALPIVCVLILVTVSMGIMGKAAPQMNLLMMGFPISISVGFIILMLFIPFMAEYVDSFFAYLYRALVNSFSTGSVI
ncbi:flagellar biosynthetic protein FliR [Spirochaetia bacterium 38H-sp]|uniref:Flagellar biosynthetic protein FliR n=1 Tax=Rarispira pelagica TaxID=3141764 RepID=A0ABU9UEQ6_9SPIR